MTLYFKVGQYEAPPSGWTIVDRPVGAINVDETKQFVYDGAFRVKPSSIPDGRLTETINLVVQAYYDSGYTNFYSQDNFTVTFNFLDLNSPVWTILYHDDFDDGTSQGWTYSQECGDCSWGSTSLKAVTTYYRSFQYSLELYISQGKYGWRRAAFKKSFDIGLANEVYLVFSVRSDNWNSFDDYGIRINGVTYFKSDVMPQPNVWYQFAIPLRIAETNTVEIWVSYIGTYSQAYAYLDDVFVISK